MWLARVKDLSVYPLKSGRAMGKTAARVDDAGLEHDREWMLVDARGMFISQRTHARLATLPAVAAANGLELGPVGELPKLTVAPPAEAKFRQVDIWSHRGAAADCGDIAAAWCSQFLGADVRLVHAGKALDRWANKSYTATQSVPLRFVDGYPILVCNQASLDDLSRAMGTALAMRSFRPNIVLDGLPPWAEDRIGRIEIGAAVISLCKPCTRCVIPSIDQTTGLAAPDPTPTLKRLRWNKTLRGVTFGENAYLESGTGATLRIGMEARCHESGAV